MSVSDKQREMLAFIEEFVGKNGYPPTYEEIRVGLHISSKSLVNYHLEALENAALLSRSPNTPRGIRLRGEAETRRVPVINVPGNMPAPDTVNPEQSEMIELTSDIVPEAGNIYALRILGNAMVDALVNNGDIVVLQPQNRAENGEMVAVRLLEQDTITLKRFYRENGHVRLQPVNPTLEPVFVKPETVEIAGKVLAIIRQVE